MHSRFLQRVRAWVPHDDDVEQAPRNAPSYTPPVQRTLPYGALFYRQSRRSTMISNCPAIFVLIEDGTPHCQGSRLRNTARTTRHHALACDGSILFRDRSEVGSAAVRLLATTPLLRRASVMIQLLVFVQARGAQEECGGKRPRDSIEEERGNTRHCRGVAGRKVGKREKDNDNRPRRPSL